MFCAVSLQFTLDFLFPPILSTSELLSPFLPFSYLFILDLLFHFSHFPFYYCTLYYFLFFIRFPHRFAFTFSFIFLLSFPFHFPVLPFRFFGPFPPSFFFPFRLSSLCFSFLFFFWDILPHLPTILFRYSSISYFSITRFPLCLGVTLFYLFIIIRKEGQSRA